MNELKPPMLKREDYKAIKHMNREEMPITKKPAFSVMPNTSLVTKSTPSTMRSQTPTLRGLRPRRTLQT